MFSWLLCFLEIACILGILTPSSSTINVEIQHAQINITWFPRKHLSLSFGENYLVPPNAQLYDEYHRMMT